MVSGVLLLGVEKKFSIKTIKRVFYLIVGVSIVSVMTNFVYYHLFQGLDSILVSVKYNNTLTIKNIDKAYHLWYMFYYLPLFILSIPLSAFTAKASQEQLAWFCGFVVLWFCGFVVFCLFLDQWLRWWKVN